MSKFNSDQIAKTQLIITEMGKKIELIKDKGLDESFLSKLQSENDQAAVYNSECDKLKAEFRAKVSQANKKLDEVKKQVQLAKKIIKKDFDKTLWHEFGIYDQR